ncbi:endophilin-B2 [Cylas formicarius]|uniref:endophilin-B2 n=1 Tax=Cylas formicarius TaxID=197179 RepID=UPI002958372E|nr:endophilin-B2 [Cylas formicarius]
MDFNVKKIVKDAGTALSRVVQLTEEKLGKCEKTELDPHFERLLERAENTKKQTEKLVRSAEAVLVPNPSNRIEDYIYEKIDKQKPPRLSNLEYMGLDMVETGTVLGAGTPYGATLVKVGQWEQKLGQTEREFIGIAGMCFTQPLKRFLDTEMRTIAREQSTLEMKRLDLDACKNRVRRARSMLGQSGEIPAEFALEQAEQDLRVAQSEFDRQVEIVKLLLEGLGSSQDEHLKCLHDFVETQARFYSQCATVAAQLRRELDNCCKSGPVLRLNSEELECLNSNAQNDSYNNVDLSRV